MGFIWFIQVFNGYLHDIRVWSLPKIIQTFAQELRTHYIPCEGLDLNRARDFTREMSAASYYLPVPLYLYLYPLPLPTHCLPFRQWRRLRQSFHCLSSARLPIEGYSSYLRVSVVCVFCASQRQLSHAETTTTPFQTLFHMPRSLDLSIACTTIFN